MLDTCVRLISAFLRDPEHGIQEIASTLPRKNINNFPDDEEPPDLTDAIFNDSDDLSVAKDLTAPTVPAIVVFGDSSADISLRGYKIAKDVSIIIAYITDADADELTTNRACGYVLRAGVISLQRFNDQKKSAPYRSLNGVSIHEIRSVTEQRIAAPLGRQRMWGYLDVKITALETYQ